MAAELSQEQLGVRVGYSGAQVGKVETGERSPSPHFAAKCDEALPAAGGLFIRIYALARRWDGGYPLWFAGWIEAERRATSLRYWEPLLVPGLLQTADYARALFLRMALGGRRRGARQPGRRPDGATGDPGAA
jgi:transcriptional regulator with XRE-family HTH domain